MKTYSFGLVSYLNTSPFRFGLRELGQTRWRNEVPSRLLALLQEGEVEAAVLPAFDVLRHPEIPVLAGSCIASYGAAHSVKLFSRVPLCRATSVALDTGSHASAALTRIVFGLRQQTPSFVEMDPDLPRMLAAADAALLIGDPCMQADASGVLVTDLGDEWLRLTGLPFVFALWGARRGADCAALADVVTQAKRIGVAQVERVAQEECERVDLPRDVCLTYLRDHMRYDLDESAQAGLERFRQLAVDQGLIADAGPIRIAAQTNV